MALPTVIKKLSKVETRKGVDNFCNILSNGTNTRELLDMLYQKDTLNDVQTIYNCLSDVYSVENVSVGEGRLGKDPFSGPVFKLLNNMTLIPVLTVPSRMTAYTTELDAQR